MTNDIIIHDGNYTEFCTPQLVNGERKGFGCVPRDWARDPAGSRPNMKAVQFATIPRAEWADRIKDKVTAQSRLTDVRNGGADGKQIPSLDQGQWGYCWAHSTTHCNMLLRALANMKYNALSAFAVAATIKKGANDGGWGAQSADFIADKGQPTQEFWPQGDADYKKYANAAVWGNAAQHKTTEAWADMDVPQYDRKLTFEQVITLLLSNCPCVGDFNWWGHSVALLDAVNGATQRDKTRDVTSGKLLALADFDLVWGMNDPATGGIGIDIWNSWSNSWGRDGIGTLTGSKAIPDGCVAPRVTTFSAI